MMKTLYISLFIAAISSSLLAEAKTLLSIDQDPIRRVISETHNLPLPGTSTPAFNDILWVVDDSGSMQIHQNAVRNALVQFISPFLQQNTWKMGLVTTDTSRDPLLGFAQEFNSLIPNPDQILDRAFSRIGTNGAATEKSFESIIRAVTQYPNFLRSASHLSLIFVTDENEQSPLDANQLIAALRQIRPDLASIKVFTFLAATDLPGSNNNCRSGVDWNYAGSKFEALVNVLPGSNHHSLCAADLNQAIANAGQSIAQNSSSGLAPLLTLTQEPIITTLKLFYSGVEIPMGAPGYGKWLYDFRRRAVYVHDQGFMDLSNRELTITYRDR